MFFEIMLPLSWVSRCVCKFFVVVVVDDIDDDVGVVVVGVVVVGVVVVVFLAFETSISVRALILKHSYEITVRKFYDT